MHIALYIVWFLIPSFFFIMAAWGLLEKFSNKHKKENPGDFFKQGIFVLACVLLCVLIDQTILPAVSEALIPEYLSLGFWQVVLLPLVLLIGSKLVGGSSPILISRAPHPSRDQNKPKDKKR
ncbi:MAG: hypothetical protein DCC75_07640 [Proteobacteria bacterium]|nr:MAG: hypothetical protein DCC75_07640 [Pseudomonadota bacterium]